MRVLFVAPVSGPPMPFVRREADALRAAGHEVEIFEFDNRYAVFIGELRRLRACIRRRPPDLVHAQFGKFNALVAALAAGATPMVITFRGTDINHNTRYSRARSALGVAASQLAACFARGIVCVSPEIRAKVWACRWRPSLVLPTGVDLRLFTPADRAASRRRLGYGLEERIVLFNAGKNPAVKDPDLAHAAVAQARRLVGNIRFVVLDGSAQPDGVPLYMNAADVLLVTSLTEGSPTVVQEAMGCNLPVVSVDVGDVRERLQGVAACEVVAGRDPAEIGSAMARVLHAAKRSDGRAHAAALGVEAIAARLADFYALALGRAAPGASIRTSSQADYERTGLHGKPLKKTPASSRG